MEYRNLGRHGLKVSTLSIGGWLTFGGTLDEAGTRSVVKASIDHGMNFIDLADVYARGKAEQVAGQVLKDYDRQDLVVSSKVYWPMGEGPNARGLGRKHITESIENTLSRLDMDYLDIYFCHRYDTETPLEETVDTMNDLVRRGRILYWGTSVWEADQLDHATTIANARHQCGPAVEQPRYNLLDRHIEESILPTARRLGIGLVLWSPLAQGMLTGKYNDGIPAGSRALTSDWMKESLTEENLEKCRRFTALAREAGHEPGPLALAWLLAREGVTSAITGASTAEQVNQNCVALEISIDPELEARIEACFSSEAEDETR